VRWQKKPRKLRSIGLNKKVRTSVRAFLSV